MDSCVLYQNAEHTITILDIPRSIEEAQGFCGGHEKRIISSAAVEQPFASVEPKSAKALRNAEPVSIKSLLLERFLQIALEDVRAVVKGPWCSPRVTEDTSREVSQVLRQKTTVAFEDILPQPPQTQPIPNEKTSHPSIPNGGRPYQPYPTTNLTTVPLFHQNPAPTTQNLHITTTLPHSPSTLLIPPHSTLLHGPISTTTSVFTSTAPRFSLAILDPPWPNRSATRSGSYSVSRDVHTVTTLLAQIPLAEHLADDALVGVWVTNKAAVWEVVLGDGGSNNGGGGGGGGGLFEAWDVELIEEWVWLKITSRGEPICALGGTWRRAYEVLLVGRRKKRVDQRLLTTTGEMAESSDSDPEVINNNSGSGSSSSSSSSSRAEIKRRVIIGVPDLHSRKPNLKALFEPLLPRTYEALEVFARNLTAGWWGWGDEVLRFQGEECWVFDRRALV